MGELRVRTEVIEALQATAAALMAQCQALLPSQQPESSILTAPVSTGACLHEKREKAPRMGAEFAWYCPDCHDQGDK